MILKQRKAFSMLTAIFIIVLMSSVAALVMSTAGKIVKETTTQYQKEQAVLLAKSYTELAIMSVSANADRSTANCLETVKGDYAGGSTADGGYSVTSEISYIFDSTVVQSCNTAHVLTAAGNSDKNATNIIVDVYVRYRDLDNIDNQIISYHRRTLQKI